MELTVKIGDNIRKRRKEIGVTRATFSKVLKLSPATFAKIERNEKSPSIDNIFAMAVHLNCSPLYLLGLEDSIGTREERMLVQKYNGLKTDQKNLLNNMIDYMEECNKKENEEFNE